MSGGLLVNCSGETGVWGSNQLIVLRISTGLAFRRRHEMLAGELWDSQSPLSIWPELLLLPVSYLQLRHFKYKEQEICWRKIWVKICNWKLPNQPAHTQLSWCRSLCVPTQIPWGAARTMWYWGYLAYFTECCTKWLHKILCKYQSTSYSCPWGALTYVLSHKTSR